MLARCVGTVLARLVKERMLELRYTVRAKGEVEKTGSPPVGGGVGFSVVTGGLLLVSLKEKTGVKAGLLAGSICSSTCSAQGEVEGGARAWDIDMEAPPSIIPGVTVEGRWLSVRLLLLLILKLLLELLQVVESAKGGPVRQPLLKSVGRRGRTLRRVPLLMGRVHGGRVRRGGEAPFGGRGEDSIRIVRERETCRLHRRVQQTLDF